MNIARVSTAALAALAATSAFAFDHNDDATISFIATDPESMLNARRISGMRPTSISANRHQPSETKVTATWVNNVGTHNKAYLYRYDQTAAQINALAADGYRVQDVEGYVKDGETTKKFAVLFFRADSDPAQTKWFDNLTQAQLYAQLSSYQGRLLDLDAYTVGNEVRFTGVMRKNTGDDAMGWWWTPNGATWEQVGEIISDKKTRLVDLCQLPNGKYYAAYWSDGAGAYRYFGQRTWASMQKSAAYYGMRVQSISHEFVNGESRYSGVMVNTKNALTRRVGSWLRSRTDGDVGAYLRQVDGPVLADLQENTSFYPSSTMKVFMHARAISATAESQLGTREIPVWVDHNDTDHAGDTFTNTPLPAVLWPMMWDSSNQMANTCLDFWGMQGTENYIRSAFGVSDDTQINHFLGIGRPYSGSTFNSATLIDLGRVYEGVNKSFSTTRLNFFRTQMINDANSNGIDGPAGEYRTSLGITDSQWSAWRARYQWHAKAGSNEHPSGLWNGYSSIAGHITLPFKSPSGTITTRRYVFGAWVNGADVKNDANPWDAGAELVRDEVRASLLSFKN
ncbi:MAG: hypothetical protein ACO1SV_02985 [Fimbriimonas sp.]